MTQMFGVITNGFVMAFDVRGPFGPRGRNAMREHEPLTNGTARLVFAHRVPLRPPPKAAATSKARLRASSVSPCPPCWIFCLLSLLIAPAASVGAQASRTPRSYDDASREAKQAYAKETEGMVLEYLRVANRYREGHRDEALKATAALDEKRLTRILSYVQESIHALLAEAAYPGKPNASTRVDVAPETMKALCAAALLHAELAIREGRKTLADRDVGAARRLISILAPAKDPERLRERITLFIAWHLHGHWALIALGAHLEDARKLFPDDAEVLLASGARDETMASPKVEPPDSAADRRDMFPPVTQSLGKAEHFYREALARDPTLVEARVRLGRVLHLRGRDNAALRELARARTEVKEPDLRYLTALFEGRVHEEAGRRAEAIARYRAALAVFPAAAIAHLALSHVSYAGGDAEAARAEATAALAAPDASEWTDPWWLYDFGQYRKLERLVAALREDLRK